jgi:hypothetical protein
MHELIPFFFALMVIAILDLILSGMWAAPYFRYGIPVYSKTVPFYAITSSTAISDLLSKELPRGWGPSQVFYPISENEVAFREKLFELRGVRYTPIMQGLITVLPLERTMVIKGHLNWFIIAFGAFSVRLVGAIPADFGLAFVFVGCLTVILIYFIQARTYKRVVEILRQKGQGVL